EWSTKPLQLHTLPAPHLLDGLDRLRVVHAVEAERVDRGLQRQTSHGRRDASNLLICAMPEYPAFMASHEILK
ncbi:MAG TPA: hypothetical protein VMU21_12265, partial [Thermodesulfovibrionales bacterium]|nr:hypothetical protein [Thermodesulfovibrionales bacterium]